MSVELGKYPLAGIGVPSNVALNAAAAQARIRLVVGAPGAEAVGEFLRSAMEQT